MRRNTSHLLSDGGIVELFPDFEHYAVGIWATEGSKVSVRWASYLTSEEAQPRIADITGMCYDLIFPFAVDWGPGERRMLFNYSFKWANLCSKDGLLSANQTYKA